MAGLLVISSVLTSACSGTSGDESGCPAPATSDGTRPDTNDGGASLSISPATMTVPIGRSQIFVAPQGASVTWTITEGNAGGSVDAHGRYTAPSSPGVYHLVATDGATTASATVTVARYTLSAMVGTTGGAGNLDGVGAEARFHQPYAVTNDGAGTLYVGDTYNAVIRKVVVATGEVTTFAGKSGVFGSADGIGTAAEFSMMSALAMDKANGILYVADTGNNAVRAVDVKTGAVTTLAGGSQEEGNVDAVGLAARFAGPAGIGYVDGVVYVSDSSSHTLRRIDVATKNVTTVAGTANMPGTTPGVGAAARFYSPGGIGVVNANLIYVADVVSNTVRRVDIAGATYSVTTYAGSTQTGHLDGPSATAQFANPIDIAVAGGTVFVADWANNDIRSISAGAVATFAGNGDYGSDDGIGLAAGLSRPTAITTDGTTIWVADQYNSAIRSIDIATKKVTTLAGKSYGTNATTSGPFDIASVAGPSGFAIAKDDAIYMTERYGCDVRMLSMNAKAIVPIAGKGNAAGSVDGKGELAQFLYPEGLAFDDAGHLLVTDSLNYAVRDVDVATGEVTTPYGSLTPADEHYVDGIGSSARFTEPQGIVYAAGKFYVTDPPSNVVRQIDPLTKTVSTAFGSLARASGADDGVGTMARFHTPQGLATDGQGHLFVADRDNSTIRTIDLTTGMVTTLAGTAGAAGSVDGRGAQARFVQPRGLFWDGEGSLFVSDEGDSTIRRVYVPTRAVATFAGQSGRQGLRLGSIDTATLNSPTALVRTSKGTFVVNSMREGVLLALTPE